MRRQVTIRWLIEFTALIAITLAVDRVLWRWGFGRIQLSTWLSVVMWTVVGLGGLSGVYLGWRQTGVRQKIRFVRWSVTWGLLATLTNAVLLGSLIADSLQRADSTGYYFDWQRDWYLQLKIILLATLMGCIVSLLLAILIATSAMIREANCKAKVGSE
jgi:hypothetical protein